MTQTSGANPGPIPPAKKDDSEDVAWALSTAEAMFARGDRADALKWLRRAAESASEAQADDRALELAKAAADLSSLVGPSTSAPAPVTQPQPSRPPPPFHPAPSAGAVVAAQVVRSSAPPPPPMRTSAPPPPPSVRPVPMARPMSAPPPPPPSSRPAGGIAPKPAARTPLAVTPVAPRVAESRRTRRSRPDIQIARPPDEVSQTMQDMAPPPPPIARRRARSRPAAEEVTRTAPVPMPPATPPTPPTVTAPPVTRRDEGAWPQGTTPAQDDFAPESADEKTRIGVPAYEASARMATDAQSAPALPVEEQEPAIRPAQAIRVVVWRTMDGVRVAPHGTRVAAITVDAVLSGLDPDVDLVAWLSGK